MRINRNHPWLLGCRFFAIPDGSGAMKNLLGGVEGSVANAPALTRLGHHPALLMVPASSQATTFGTPASYGFTGPEVTVLCRARPDNLGATFTQTWAVSSLEAADAAGYGLLFSNFGSGEVGWCFVVTVGGGHMVANDGTGVATLGIEHVVAGRYENDITRVSVFIDGRLGGMFVNGAAWDVTAADPIYVGQYRSGRYFDGALGWVAIFDRALSDFEIWRFSRDWEWPFFDDDGGELYLGNSQVTYRNVVGIGDVFTVLSPVTYTTDFEALGAFGGDIISVPDGTGAVTYENVIGISDRYIGGVPTLVFYTNVIAVGSSFTANSPVLYSTVIHIRDRFVGLVDGRVDLIGVFRYRR